MNRSDYARAAGWDTVMKVAGLKDVAKAVSKGKDKVLAKAREGVSAGDAIVYGGIPTAGAAYLATKD